MTKKFDRRALMRTGLLGGVGSAFALEQLGGVPMFGNWVSKSVLNPAFESAMPHLDAYQMIQNALSGGAAALRVHQAMAEGQDDWALVQIKVCNHLATPLVFFLEGGLQTTANGKGGQTTDYLTQAGVNEASDIPRWSELKLNRWFASILNDPTTSGASETSAINDFGLSSGQAADADVGPFPENAALQAFMQLAQNNPSGNHTIKNCELRNDRGDITLFAQEKGLIKSPLGITALMMGESYDNAEGALQANAVVGPGGNETAIVASKTVGDYVGQIQQFVNAPSYADRASIEQNVIYKLDQIVVEEPILRRELINSIQKFKSGLGALGTAADISSTRYASLADANATGSKQSQQGANGTNGSSASGEFIGQCKYVIETLKMTGKPLRNFSLFLNIADIDNRTIDNATINVQRNSKLEAYSYVEGMRQLAMGLNMLGRAIAVGAKMMVVVTSEGGRNADLGDSKTSFAFVLGPGGAGHLKDKVYLSNAALADTNSPQSTNPGGDNGAAQWDVTGLVDGDGNAVEAPATTGDVQMGVVEYLEELTGSGNQRSEFSGADARYVKLERS